MKKKNEYDNEKILCVFKKIINNENSYINFNRINVFKRFFSRMEIGMTEIDINMSFPFNKRTKISSL